MNYSESDDKAFMDKFLRVRSTPAAYPYFDPFAHSWLTASYAHSNMATFRKNTFYRSWGACTWANDSLQLAGNYAEVFASKVLSKGGLVNKIPAVACAVWFYKRPSSELRHDHPFVLGLPASERELLAQFRDDFHFGDDTEWNAIFELGPDLTGYNSLMAESADA